METAKELLAVFFLLVALYPIPGRGQSEALRIAAVDFTGLKKTKAAFLRDQLDLEEGKPIGLSQLAAECQHLKNLTPVANAEYRIDTMGKVVSITFEVEEALTLFPILNFGVGEGNFWFQLGFTDLNWLGRGHQLTAFYQNNDRRHNGSFHYRVPRFGDSPWGASVHLLRWASIEPLYFDEGTVFYDYDNHSAGATGIYHLDRGHFVEFGATLFQEGYRKNERHESELTAGPDQLRQTKGLFKLIHYLGKVDAHAFYHRGFDNRLSLQTVHNFSDDSWFHILVNDSRYFHRISSRGNLAARLRLGIATNRDTPFAPFVLDSYINIRGAGNRMERGTAAAVLNLEYRQTVFDSGTFAGQLVAFSDLGSWRNPGESLGDLITENSIRHFVGGGVRLIYKKAFNAILRLDYGFEVSNVRQRGLVIGVGQYF